MTPDSALPSILGTWKLISYVREVFSSEERFNQFGENPAGYLGYSADGRMYLFLRARIALPRAMWCRPTRKA
jgi:hypothetical protein